MKHKNNPKILSSTTLCLALVVLALLALTTINALPRFPVYTHCDAETTPNAFCNAHHNNYKNKLQQQPPQQQTGHVLTALAMAMTSHSAKTTFQPHPQPTYTPKRLVNYMQQFQSQIQLFADHVDATLLSHLSPHLHLVATIVGNTINDKEQHDMCEFINQGKGFYLLTINDNVGNNASTMIKSTVWPTHCAVKHNQQGEQMLMTIHHPVHGVMSNIDVKQYFEAQRVLSVNQILVSYNQHEQQLYNALQQQHQHEQQQTPLYSLDEIDEVYQQMYQAVANKNRINKRTHNKRTIPSITYNTDEDFIIPYPMPIFWRQCDERWKDDVMDITPEQTYTVCAVGCLMCSVSVGLNNYGFLLPNQTTGGLTTPNPGTFNRYVKDHNGYDQANLKHDVINTICTQPQSPKCYAQWDEKFGRHAKNDLAVEQVIQYLHDPHLHVVANVNNGRHFVAIHGYGRTNNDTLAARDSSGSAGREWFSHTQDIVGYRIYNMTNNNQMIVDTTKTAEDDAFSQLIRDLGL